MDESMKNFFDKKLSIVNWEVAKKNKTHNEGKMTARTHWLFLTQKSIEIGALLVKGCMQNMVVVHLVA
jgi:hypothetical protein